MNAGLILIQDGAQGQGCFVKETKIDLNERGIYPIFWPAFSPDLNLIETVWDRTKDYIERYYPEYHTLHDKAWACGEKSLGKLSALMSY
jgi:transposase